jgi:hypothetical protein
MLLSIGDNVEKLWLAKFCWAKDATFHAPVGGCMGSETGPMSCGNARAVIAAVVDIVCAVDGADATDEENRPANPPRIFLFGFFTGFFFGGMCTFSGEIILHRQDQCNLNIFVSSDVLPKSVVVALR